ncbi:Arm DNA-binding domain-containing protein [Variovorax sp. CAN2819]|uniref:Arm DNA-binding domain-containing protein n=1 Tax=Variovorax sp. CAN15 TaxID=3046727 RepID=UPI00264770B3|nr:Arm DNA-binding domain-containing protein [Variovorax sp. CAN15]MDN6883079.1 Arm DNA-binding domain-containing protein [Variovorax sp. CAN15]
MLTDKHCKNAARPPDKKRARLTDSSGLYLEVSPAGSKRWFWKTYANGKEGRMALGSYPTMNLAEARKARDTAKLQKADGIDPIPARKVQKLKATDPAGDLQRGCHGVVREAEGSVERRPCGACAAPVRA